MTIQRLLVANRGEIARRVFATCRRLGIETVAVHSDADAGLPFVREADVAVRLPGATPAETYLRADLVLDAARRAGADAIHPGYGFLSENADFARAVVDAGLTWVGPAPESIEQMGSKVESKKLMEAAGVPVLANLTPDTATEADLPLLVKASAGGGGRGMRIVRALSHLPGEIEKAAAEAESAFGDGTVFVEPYVEHGRHVEVQVVGHAEGVLVLGERDCSLQRRHQKVVEETPAPGLTDATRHALHEAARAAAAAIDYRGAGTVEFLVDAADTSRFWFLEMNTRLQVEHPVTELVHGVDLVDLQLTVAEDRPLDARAIGETYGHAIEVRLYAEDPAADWQPQSGTLATFDVPGVDGEFDLLNRPGIRLDSGFESGSEVSTHYDAMLAKVIAWGTSRDQAARRLADALAKARLHGLVTNRDLLVRILRSPEFVAGDVSTDFFDRTDVVSTGSTDEGDRGAAVAAAIALAERDRLERTVQRGIPVAWRNVVAHPQRTEFVVSASSTTEGEPTTEVVEWFGGRDGYRVDGLTVVTAGPERVVLEQDGVRTSYDVAVGATGSHDVDVDSPAGHVRLRLVPRFTDPADAVASGSLLAPMPGTVVRVAVEVGAQVEAGQAVLVLEAMKMQHTVSAPTAGTVTQIDVQPGAQVAAGDVLAVVEGDEA
ncbi:biotin carboxylase N-terminal domain-containing protein [Nocardioides sp. LS1]|uniref:acetyl/propionyl/methylcrotonyl-CoA carboxylase subunit alpha n=1 Tax=Nocardioides sp. LS1 TaxID=1027620 RepID=UPI000F6264AB|nr:biotin carboxylase N-terminal domain-containing protein [Nocardioides sp. LS1]GCD90367.1 acetyl/propionyl-CoA carboxylase subuit alpha [Nocardioides sp. LS1]